MFGRVLVANRGEIACRIIATLRRLGIESVAVYSEADADGCHVRAADHAVLLGPAPAAESYLDAARVLDAAHAAGAEAIHPGYGFLSENAGFARACAAAGIAFVGPSPAHLELFGAKHTARDAAAAAAVPLLAGSGVLADLDHAAAEAERVGYPVMLKASAGGGGIGMRRCDDADALAEAFVAVQGLAVRNFADAALFLERAVDRARHLEVQIFGDGEGTVVDLGERDCTLQRRNQKVVEETPGPNLSAPRRDELVAAAVRLGASVAYASAGTVEFLYDADRDEIAFLEVNTRLQVEHGVTELTHGIDLVEWMLRLAAGDGVDLTRVPRPVGHAVQARLYAEDPARDYAPSAGLVTEAVFPPVTQMLRIDAGIDRGVEVPVHYDPLLAKILVHGPTRAAALDALDAALASVRIGGVATNLALLQAAVRSDAFRTATHTTATLADVGVAGGGIEVVAPGTHTSVQDLPGRIGLWDVGVPPSGPMDDRSHRLANRLLGNAATAATLECTRTGPTLTFRTASAFVLCGAPTDATLDGVAVPHATVVQVPAGATLDVGSVGDAGGWRTYLAVRGGFDVPFYLASRSTFALGGFGGHAGRTLRTGDVLALGEDVDPVLACVPGTTLDPALVPVPARRYVARVLLGPHGAPDFFTDDDIAVFLAADWEVHYNSDRTGIRLIGPKPKWARADGGEAGLHPSNIHDTVYAVGTVDFTGDMPVLLGRDGPSLGGFVCPATVIAADRHLLGQLRPGDTLRFVAVDDAVAADALAADDAEINTLRPAGAAPATTGARPAIVVAPALPVVATSPADAPAERVEVAYRRAGDDHVLVEFGPMALDLHLRLRADQLQRALALDPPAGVVEVSPGIRSLQVRFDPRRTGTDRICRDLDACERSLPPLTDVTVPSRIVELPLSWDDPQARLAMRRYAELVRPDAPWCPDNIEFIRRINGLDSIAEVHRILFAADWFVLGLGDVYLGAPVATPLDPRHRLVTTKYNPARTWTPENAVGIGGAYLCVYGMEGPGGYQLVGRTVQVWNRWRTTPEFTPGCPWLLRNFDRIRFVEVDGDELAAWRRELPSGRRRLTIRDGEFSLAAHDAMLAAEADGIAAFTAQRQAAFAAERARWEAAGLSLAPVDAALVGADEELLPDGAIAVEAPLPGSVWKVLVSDGDVVTAGEPVVVLESMKMEHVVVAPHGGTVGEIRVAPGREVAGGQVLVVLT